MTGGVSFDLSRPPSSRLVSPGQLVRLKRRMQPAPARRPLPSVASVSGSVRDPRRAVAVWALRRHERRELVAVEAEPEPYALVRMRPDCSRKRHFAVPPAGSLALPRWSPSGRWILFEHGTSEGVFVWRVRPDGSGMRRVVRGKLHTWAPDGRRFAYTDGRDIWSVRVDGRGRRRVLRCPDDTTVAGLAWSPDGRRIAFVRQVPWVAGLRGRSATLGLRHGPDS